LSKNVAPDWLTDVANAALLNHHAGDYRKAFARVRGLADQRITLFDATVGVGHASQFRSVDLMIITSM
jgi:hypothetical protein